MKDILQSHGVELRLGLADEADAEYEARAAQELEYADANDHGDDESESE